MSIDQRIREGLHSTSNHLPEPDTNGALDAVTAGARTATRRRGLIAGGLAAAAVAAAVAIALSVTGGNHAQDVPPAEHPSQTPTDSTGEEWTPERIRAEGSHVNPAGEGEVPTTESGLAAHLYRLCDGPSCDGANGSVEDMHVALEVSQDGRSAVFDLRWSGQPWVRTFDEDSVLVQDAERSEKDGPVRYRLLQADGTAVELELVDDPTTAQPGPGVFVIENFQGWTAGMGGVDEVFLVDDKAGTLRPLDVPEEVRYWGPNADEFLWGVTSDCRVFWSNSGTVEDRRLSCRDGAHFTWMSDDWYPTEWLRPGRMVMAEQLDDRMNLHVSLDHGDTWQRIPVKDDTEVADVLRQLS